MKKLSRKEFLTVSVMLFGLFFGAGNLIFPPLLGNQAGSKTLISLLSFAVTAVVFPVLGVIAVSKTGGLTKLADRVGKRFSLVFTTAIYLSIGPGLGYLEPAVCLLKWQLPHICQQISIKILQDSSTPASFS
jgi:LIVCS family branched-chain amino acid:cation transporter